MTTAVGHPLNRIVSFRIPIDAVQDTIDDQHCFQRKTPFRSITADTGFELDGLAVDEFVRALPPHQLDDGLIKRLENVH